jgi:hypothetical protein
MERPLGNAHYFFFSRRIADGFFDVNFHCEFWCLGGFTKEFVFQGRLLERVSNAKPHALLETSFRHWLLINNTIQLIFTN